MPTSPNSAIALAALTCALLGGCATVAPEPPTVLKELRPGYVAGYLDAKEYPDSLALLPGPPASGSAGMAADEQSYRSSRSLRGTPRWDQAAIDADLNFPKAAEHFACSVGIGISAEKTPHLYMLLRRVRMDASRATDRAKDHYQRLRPFMVAKDPICTPHEAARFKAESYPSAHASIGWAWSLVLAEAAPERAGAIYARGLAFGDSRTVCGVHYESDVNAGRVIGAATVSRLHANDVFAAQLVQARKEIAAARAAGDKPANDCAAEAKALARPH